MQKPADGAYACLLRSSRVSARTREAVEARGRADDPGYVPRVLHGAMLTTLRTLLDRIIPQETPHAIDLAARIDRLLAEGEGNGWRLASLPEDRQAYRAGLGTLDRLAQSVYGTPFVMLKRVQMDELIQDIIDARESGNRGSTGTGNGPSGDLPDLDVAQMRAWFEDVRADAVRLYVLTPHSLARMGYSGIANGGDGQPKSGFEQVGLDEREDWEPLPVLMDLP